MRNRFIALLCAFLFALSTSLPVFADSALLCPHCGGNLTVKAQKLNIGAGADASTYKCDSCGRWAYANGVGGLDLIAVGSQAILDSAERSGLLSITYSEVPSSSLGTPPEGYVGEGVPTYNSDGNLFYVVYPKLGPNDSTVYDYPASFTKTFAAGYYKVNGLSVYFEVTDKQYSSSTTSSYIYCRYSFIPPVSGLYYIATDQDYFTNFSKGLSSSKYTKSAGSYSASCSKGSSTTIFTANHYMYGLYGQPFTAYFHPLVLTVVPNTSTVSNQTSITIKDNSFNGNIYVDNSSNITYIYPQYTTITEEGDTVTNISETAIIYNNTTNQYVTYDQSSNSYYYITINETPDPTPTPDPGSDLEPTPTPAPGGGYDDTNLLDKLGLWFADVNLNLNLAIENLALNFNTAIENLSADFDVYIKDLSANFTAVIEELQLNFKLAIENLNLTIQNYFGGGSGGSGCDISTPETAEPSPTPEPTPPLLEEEEPVDSFLVQWLRAVVEHIQELLEPVQAVGSVYSDFYSYLPAPWQSALLGVFALLLVFALWRIFHG